MIFIKIAVIYIMCKYIARGFCEDEAKKRDKLKEDMKHEKFLVMEAYDLMRKEKARIVSTVRELRAENEKLRWKLAKVKK